MSITKLDWVKSNKRVLFVVLAIVFLFAVLFTNSKSSYFNKNSAQNNTNAGLTYDMGIVEELVSKDTDLDGLADWEESLWGTDPTKKETTPGVSDAATVERLKLETKQNTNIELPPASPENDLTETEKFSREFLSTVATLNQNGEMDQATMDKLGEDLANHIQNSSPRKVYALSEIKIIKDDSVASVKKYDSAMDSLQKKYPMGNSVMDILQRLSPDGNTVDTSVLSELDPVIKSLKSMVMDLVKLGVPQSLSTMHLELVNTLERLAENVTDVQFFETDTIVALSAMTQYNQNIDALEANIINLQAAVNKKLSN